VTTQEELRSFKRALKTGKATRADWNLWCWLCDEPQVVAYGYSPLIECWACKSESEARAEALERLYANKEAV
jgi:hypothetical protein